MLRREWELPLIGIVCEEVDQPDTWGKSYFWYCASCGDTYAKARLYHCNNLRFVKAVAGRCPDCPCDRWSLAGSIEAIDFVGVSLPEAVVKYQFEVEMKFLDHPNHPYNQEQFIG